MKDLKKDLQNEQEKVTDLNKNKLVVERDNLLAKVDSMNTVISNQIKTLADKDKQIETEKANAITKAEASKNDGKAEAMASILNSYKNRSFDDLIKFSSRESVNRDLPFLGDNPEIKPLLNDLLIFFSAQDLLSEKFDATRIRNAQTLLNQIKHQSKLLDAVKEDVEYYKDFNAALKETVSKVVNLDKSKSADGDAEIQELKFKEIVVLLDFLYNYYDYSKYPYLSKIFIEIVKRRKPNADADISRQLCTIAICEV
ncbi:MAG: hypothetical protein IPG21_05265 [Saprospiraceae bacterium]|nr:hypothetical protein [Candidatus Vicinibacter affinis]